MRSSWRPQSTTYSHWTALKSGQFIAHAHAVWRIVEVTDRPIEGDDRDAWLKAGMPEPTTWPNRPYRIDVEWVGGVRPDWAKPDADTINGVFKVRAMKFRLWDVYRGERWPQCSCCGEPTPCRAELEDQQVTASLNEVARLEAIPAGACWACTEPISTRQKTVTYPGENLDLPGGQEPVFHTRASCQGEARRYEERWVAVDPRRERILTYPPCGGILLVHGDGSSECITDRSPLGTMCESVPGCIGHLSHDHTTIMACYKRGSDMAGRGAEPCPRGCSREDHPGCRTSPRPERRTTSTDNTIF